MVASGNDEHFDFELIRNEKNQLFIPASGFAGMMRKHFYTSLDNLGEIAISSEQLWGTENTKASSTFQSHLIIDDLICTKESAVMVRDGVEIGAYGIAVDKSKYDYQFIEPGAEFKLQCELTIRQGFNIEGIIKLVKFICAEGINGNYKQGAFTSHGFGELIWKETKVSIFKFETDVEAWFDYLENGSINRQVVQQIADFNHGLAIVRKKIAKFNALFTIKSSLIIGSPDYREDGVEIDKVHLRNATGKPLISSKSIRGPIRHRALRILNTLENPKSIHNIRSLFGFVEKAPLNIASKGRVRIKEYVFNELHQLDADQIQTRIKIDRFTQGTIDGALFTTQPIWHKSEQLKIVLELDDFIEEEIGLLLLVFKDLATGDLPLGGDKAVGRGVLIGKKLNVSIGDNHYLNLEILSEDFKVRHDSKGDLEIGKVEAVIQNKLKNYVRTN
ncbi:MAG: RAMP superfamily CRISPR-associated protein [Saprospiraceae bacterium]